MIKPGDRLRVHCICKLDDGTIVESTTGRGPVEFVVGAEEGPFPGIAEIVVGMSPGQRKKLRVPAVDAYGERRKDRICKMKRDGFPLGDPAVGMEIEIDEEDLQGTFRVTRVSDVSVTLDANHPLAGHALNVVFEIVGVEEAA